MVALLVEAHKQLTEFESISSYIPNIDILIYMNILKEALMSSQIEGTQATLEDILDPNIETNANRDIGEVLSYKKAVDYAKEKLNELPLGNRLIKQTHEVLMRGSRGVKKKNTRRISQVAELDRRAWRRAQRRPIYTAKSKGNGNGDVRSGEVY